MQQQNNQDTEDRSAERSAAARLYSGKVMHARMKPFMHRFQYRVFSLLIDLDRMNEADKQSLFFSVGRWNVLSFFPDDHMHFKGATPSPLRKKIDALLDNAGVADAGALKVELLCYPRIFGHAFNPLSVYFASNQNGALKAVIYEVRNTFGEMHTYVAPVCEGQWTDAGLRQEQDKLFHVSPFLPMGMRYRFRISPPGDAVKLRILETEANEPVLSATFNGTAKPLTFRSILTCLASVGFFSFKVLAGIHWEALKLWVKGAKYHTKPNPGPAVTLNAAVADTRAKAEPAE